MARVYCFWKGGWLPACLPVQVKVEQQAGAS
jgi:hypothetical protein